MTVLLFAATILTFLGIDYFVRRSKVPAHSAPVPHAARPVAAFRMPEGIYFSKTHTWLTLFPTGSVQLGVDDFAARMFTHARVTLLKQEGERVQKGEPIIRLEEEGKSVSIKSPIEGRITRRNARAASQEAITEGDTFLHGWAYQMQPKEGPAVLRDFFLGAETRAWMKTEVARVRDFMAAHQAAVHGQASYALQDGGEPVPGMLDHMSASECAEFEQKFLSND